MLTNWNSAALMDNLISSSYRAQVSECQAQDTIVRVAELTWDYEVVSGHIFHIRVRAHVGKELYLRTEMRPFGWKCLRITDPHILLNSPFCWNNLFAKTEDTSLAWRNCKLTWGRHLSRWRKMHPEAGVFPGEMCHCLQCKQFRLFATFHHKYYHLYFLHKWKHTINCFFFFFHLVLHREYRSTSRQLIHYICLNDRRVCQCMTGILIGSPNSLFTNIRFVPRFHYLKQSYIPAHTFLLSHRTGDFWEPLGPILLGMKSLR